MRRDSLRWRIQVWHGALLFLTVSTMSILFYLHERNLRVERSGHVLSQSVSGLVPRYLIPAPHMGGHPRRGDIHRHLRPPRPEGPPPKMETREEINKRLPLSPPSDPPPFIRRGKPPRSNEEILSNPNFYFIAWKHDGTLFEKSDNAPEGVAVPSASPYPGETFVRIRDNNQEAVHHAPASGSIIVGLSLDHIEASLSNFALKLFGGSAALVIIGMGIGWWILGRETAQLSEISKSAQRIAHGNLSERIALANPSREVDDLAEILNESFTRLERSFEQQVRFTADASHELRTPVSVILTKGQFTLSKNRPIDAYRDAIATCVDSATHMKRMIESLLELSRYDSGEAALNLHNHDLSIVASETVELLQTLADKKRIKLTTTLENATTLIDPHRFQQVCINLISNAIKHSPFGTRVNITVSKESENCVLVVADEGNGIDDKDLPFLFDRFFKGKQPTGNEKDVSGLGLAITKAIVLAHGGTIKATNRVQGGALFRIAIPINETQNAPSSNTLDSTPSLSESLA